MKSGEVLLLATCVGTRREPASFDLSIVKSSIERNLEWYVAKQKSSDSEMRARIGGVAKQMETFDVLNWVA